MGAEQSGGHCGLQVAFAQDDNPNACGFSVTRRLPRTPCLCVDDGDPVRHVDGSRRALAGLCGTSSARGSRSSGHGSSQFEALLKELFRVHDLNGNGLLEELELIQLNKKIAMLHYGRDTDLEKVKEKYQEVFRNGLDPEGRPVPYETFRRYMMKVLIAIDEDEQAQQMVVEQFIAEAEAARATFHCPSMASVSDAPFLSKLSFHDGSTFGAAMRWDRGMPAMQNRTPECPDAHPGDMYTFDGNIPEESWYEEDLDDEDEDRLSDQVFAERDREWQTQAHGLDAEIPFPAPLQPASPVTPSPFTSWGEVPPPPAPPPRSRSHIAPGPASPVAAVMSARSRKNCDRLLPPPPPPVYKDGHYS